MKKIYPSRKSFVKYDDDHFLLYLGEQKITNYQPESTSPDDSASSSSDGKSKSAETGVTAYSYEGTETDGSTKIKASSASYDDFAAGLVRLKYSQNQVEAILCNHGDGNAEHQKEYDTFQAWRIQAKEMASEVLSREV